MKPLSQDRREPLVLLPMPRVIEHIGGDVACSDELRKNLERGIGGALKGEHVRVYLCDDFRAKPSAYRLEIRASASGSAAIDIHAHDRAGELAAFQTLAQILRCCTLRLPCLRIEDHAAFETRGLMLDVSRDRVPTMQHLKHVVDLIASLKFNHLQLYTEHTFAYRGHEDVWRDASPITPSEGIELSQYAHDRGVELSANQNCFGHLAKWLKLPRYRHLAEIQRDDQEWRFMHFPRRGPFSLCPTEPQAVEFVHDLLSQIVPSFPHSSRVNIGCDETFDVGWGRSGPCVEDMLASGGGASTMTRDIARAELFFNFVREICGALASVSARAGRPATPMMWADIALHHPDLLHMLPDKVIGLAWEYEPTDKFGAWCTTLREHGHQAWVCPGTSSWRSFTGRTRERRANIADAAEQGEAAGATGFLICDWGDVGHRQQWPISLLPIAQAAEAAWNPAGARAFNPRVASHILFHDDGSLGEWLEAFGDIDVAIRAAANLRNATALFADLHTPLSAPLGERPIKPTVPLQLWHDAQDTFNRLRAMMPPVHDQLTASELSLSCARVDFALRHAISAREGPNSPSTDVLRDLKERAEHIIAEHARLWPWRSRPGGLQDSVAHDQAILAAIHGAPTDATLRT